MGLMKRVHEHRLYGGYMTTGWKVAFGLEPPPPTKEEKAEARIAARELKAEREAIRAVEREADEERRREEEAARPRVFAPPPPDFPRPSATVAAGSGARATQGSWF